MRRVKVDVRLASRDGLAIVTRAHIEAAGTTRTPSAADELVDTGTTAQAAILKPELLAGLALGGK
jgi:hypothetical protein